jgi:predicted Rossmann fold nucleotide-binding protein DprA/Smf involved in DNA uptake
MSYEAWGESDARPWPVSTPVSGEVLQRVMLTLQDEPIPADEVAKRANLGLCATYEALVHLHDRGIAFMSQEPITRRIEGWLR